MSPKLCAKLFVGILFRQISRDFISSSGNLQAATIKTQQYTDFNQQEIRIVRKVTTDI